MEPPKTAMEVHGVPVQKPNYMLMSLQRILVLVIIFACVLIVVRYTPMPGNYGL